MLTLSHTHLASHTLPSSSSTPNIQPKMIFSLLRSPKDSLEMPQQHTVVMGSRAWTCHLPVGGRRGTNAREVLGGWYSSPAH